MEKISGALLRYYRMQQNLSQEGLCKGICVVSYLSKIEQGKVDASEDILQALFARLQIHYHGDARFLSEMKQLFASFWEALDFNEPLEEHALKIRAHEKELLYSPLVIEYRLFQIYDKIMRIEETESSEVLLHSLQEIKVYENYMDELQLYRYHLLYDHYPDAQIRLHHVRLAGYYRKTAEQEIALGMAYINMGDYIEACEYLPKAYAMASEDGDAKRMITAAILIGNCYSCQNVEGLMLKYYQKAEHLARQLKDTNTLKELAYNIGSTYLEWKQYDLAKEKLLFSKDLEEDRLGKVLIAHKLALLYIEIDEAQEGKHYIEMMEEALDEKMPLIYHKMLTFIKLRYRENYLDDPNYYQVLMDIYEQDTHTYFGYRLFHSRYLLEVYTHQRRYKEAYLLLQEIQNHNFPKKYGI